MKIGDKVIYMRYDVSSWRSTTDIGWGYIYYLEDNKIGIGKYNSGATSLDTDKATEVCYVITENVIEELAKILDIEINKYKPMIKSLTSEEKNELIKNEFVKIQTQITHVAEAMINDPDDTHYINCLKEICRLKNKLFSIKVSDIENIHKYNGEIKAKINKLEDLKEKLLKLKCE